MTDHKMEWVKDREFTQGDVVVTVWKLPLRRPKFRFDISCKGRDDRVFRSFLVHFSGKGKLQMHHGCNVAALQNLVTEAEGYIQGEAQVVEDERIDQMVAYEERDLNKGKPRQPPGLKKLAKQDAAMRRIREVVAIEESVDTTKQTT